MPSFKIDESIDIDNTIDDTIYPESEVQSFTWISGTELTAMEPRKKVYVIDRILTAGCLTLNASKSKSGKTTLAVEYCHAVATGRKALGAYEVHSGPVLYWLADDANVDRFAEAWRVVNGNTPVENFHLCTKREHLYPDGMLNLRKAAEKYKPVYIVVDNYTTIRTPREKHSDFVKSEYDDLRLLSEFAAECGAAIKLIHHTSKAKQSDPFDAAAGSYAMSAGADSRMVVEKFSATGTERLVRVDGRDLDAFEFVYARGADRRLFSVVSGPCSSHWPRLSQMATKNGGTSFSAKDAGEAFGLTDRQARRVLGEWESLGALVEVERGRYLLEASIVEAALKVKKEAH